MGYNRKAAGDLDLREEYAFDYSKSRPNRFAPAMEMVIEMPEISRFFGIVVRMFLEAGSPHHRPHFHAYYQESAAVIAIDSVECIGGGLPRSQQRLVEAWAEIHLDELREDWNLLQSGQPPARIEPLH